MKLLIVEDDESFLGELLQNLAEVPNLTFTVARSRDSAMQAIREQLFDAVALDLALPTADRAMDLAVAHGEAVFGAVRAAFPGTPILFLTGSSADPIYETILDSKEKLDLWGDGTPVDTVQLYRKARVLEFVEQVRGYAERIGATDSIEIVRQGLDLGLSTEDQRVLRVMGRRFEGAAVRVAPADGGLSASRVLRMNVVGNQGHERLRGITKLGTATAVRDETARIDNLHMLKQGDFSPFILAVDQGTGSSAGTLYRLAEGYDGNLFDALTQSDARAAAIVPSIKAAIQPWFGAARVVQTTVGAIRSRYISDVQAADLGTTYGLKDLAGLEQRGLSARRSCTHGDLHGANVLIGPADRPSLIDFGDVGDAWSAIDPITLELCLFSHPSGVKACGGWKPDFSVPWERTAEYAAASPLPQFIQAVRTWAHEAAFGDQDVFANAYGYCLRQLKYPETDKDFFVAAIAQIRASLEAT
jgi:CheY-like chemotaxis protein